MDPSQKLAFEFTPTGKDYVDSFRAFTFRNRLLWVIILLFTGPQAFFIFDAFVRRDFRFDLYTEFPVYIILLFLGFYLLFSIVVNPLQVASKVKNDERLNSPIQYELDEKQLTFRNKFSETKLDWGSFQEVFETPDAYLLVYTINKNMFQVVPKRAFTTPDVEQNFRNLLALKIPKSQNSKFSMKNPVVMISLVIALGFGVILCFVIALSFVRTTFGSY